MSNYTPFVLEGTRGKERVMDLWSRLNRDRIVFLGESINDSVANRIVGQMLYLEAEDRKSDIYLYINSRGGTVSAGLAIYDVMNHVKPPISTICFGNACSMAAVLLSAGEKGKRFMLPNARVMLHQVSAGAQGHVADMQISFEQAKEMNDKLIRILADKCGKDVEDVLKDADRDFWLDAEKSVEYGVVDKVLNNNTD